MHIPGGHGLQTCFPLEEELVKVPRGHGRKKEIEKLPAISLNPEVKRAETKPVPQRPLSTAIASSSEF